MPTDDLSFSAGLDLSNWDSNVGKMLSDSDNVADQLNKVTESLDAIGGAGNIDIEIATKTDMGGVKSLLDLDNKTVQTKVEAQPGSGDSKSIWDTIKKIAIAGQAFQFVLNIAGTAVEWFNKISDIGGINGLFETDRVLGQIEQKTGRMIPGAQKLILDLYKNGFAESRTQAGDMLTILTQMGVADGDLETTARTAFSVMKTTGGDAQTTVRNLQTLVKTGLAVDVKSAGNLMVTAFQTGGGAAGDMQQTVIKFAPAFAAAGLSGAGAMALISSGLKAGFENGDKVGQSILNLKDNIGKIGTDPAVTTAFKQLDDLTKLDLKGMLKAYQQGTLSGDEFYAGLFKGLSDAQAVNKPKAEELGRTLIGSVAGETGVNPFTHLTTDFESVAGTIEGRADKAGQAGGKSLSQMLDLLKRNVEVSGEEFLTTKLAPIIDGIIGGAQRAIASLQSGGTIGQALEFGFHLEGVDAFLGNFQRIIGNLVIEFQLLVASVQDVLGKGDLAAGTRAAAASNAKTQLAFDLKLANAEEIPGMLKQALDRGVSEADVGAAVSKAIKEQADAGEIGKALDLSNAIQKGASAVVTISQGPFQQVVQAVQGANESFDQFQARVAKWKADTEAQGAGVDVKFIKVDDKVFDEAKNTIAMKAGELRQKFDEAMSKGDYTTAFKLADQLNVKELKDKATAAAEAAQKAKDSIVKDTGDMGAASDQAAAQVTKNNADMGKSMDKLSKDTKDAVMTHSIVPDLKAIREAADQNIPATIGQINLLTQSILGMGNTTAILSSVVANLQALSSAASGATASLQGAIDKSNAAAGAAAAAANAGGGKAPEKKAGGGRASGLTMVGERGPELMTLDQGAAILNNETTRSLFAILDGLSSGGFSQQFNRSSNVNVNQVIYTQSQAQSTNAALRTADAIRGH